MAAEQPGCAFITHPSGPNLYGFRLCAHFKMDFLLACMLQLNMEWLWATMVFLSRVSSKLRMEV